MKDRQRLLNLAQRASLFGSVAGAAISAVSGQVAYAAVPLSLSLVLMNDANRRHMETLQATQQSHQVTVADVQQHFDELHLQLVHLQTAITQVEQNPHKYISRTHLTPLVSKLHQLQLQQKAIELGRINKLEQQVKEAQEQLLNLQANTKTLLDRTQNLAQLQIQLASVQEAIQTEAFSRVMPPSAKPTSKPTPATVKSTHQGKHERVAIFIDAANLYHGASSLGVNINYQQLLSALTGKSTVCRVFLYTGIDPCNKKQQKFLSSMQRQGYQVFSKEVVQRADGSRKANLDVELALHMVDLVDSYDTAILVSGDGDFAFAVRRVQSRGKRVEVVSFGSNTSVALSKVADSYLDLESILDEIC